MDVPSSPAVLQGGAILHPVAAVEVKHLSPIATNEALGGLVNVTAYHIVVFVTDGNLCGRLFKIIDELDRGLDAFLHAFGLRNAALAHRQRHSIDAVVKPNQRVVPFAAEQGQPLRVLHGHIEDFTVEKPRLLAIKGKDHLVDDFKIPGFKLHELTKHLIVVPGDVKHLPSASNHLKEFAYHLHVLGQENTFS